MSELKNLKILVTGAAGFIGSELVHQLIDGNAKVIAVDNLINGKKENLVDIPEDKFDFIIDDIRNINLMKKLLKEVDIVFHLACLGVRHSIHSPFENHEVNATATLNLLLLSKELGVKKFVYVSSSEVYGTARYVPMTEEHPTYPMTVYGSSKLAGECYTRAFYETYKYPTLVIRPFNTYGPRCHHEGDSGEVIPKFLLRSLCNRPMIIFGDGTQTRDFTYVSDTARGIIMSGLSDKTTGQTINLGNGKEISINDLAEEVKKVTEKSDTEIIHDISRPGDVLRLYANMEKAKSLTGYEPEISLKEGLIKLKEWYLQSGKSPEELLKNEIVRNWEAK